MFLRRPMVQFVRGFGMLVAFSGAAMLLSSGCVPPGTMGGGNANDNTGGGNANANDNTGGGNTNANDNTSTEPDGFTNASVKRGGSLYDKWWVVAGVDAPTEDHPRWATRPDQDSDMATGADTWRCKECHGWDYKGVDGAYASGDHRTGFPGIFGTTLSSQDVFDNIKTDHGFGDTGLTDADIWDLAKFVLEGQIDTDDIIGADGTFTGDTANGQVLFEGGIGSNPPCSACHGVDGTLLLFDGGTLTLGGAANESAWELQHKIRFGNPGTAMPAAVDVDATNDDVADVGAYAQTLTTDVP